MYVRKAWQSLMIPVNAWPFVASQVAEQSVTIKCMLEDTGADAPVPLLNVNSKILAKVVEYCKQHAPTEGVDNAKAEELKTWDTEFVKVDQSTLFELILVRVGWLRWLCGCIRKTRERVVSFVGCQQHRHAHTGCQLSQHQRPA